MKYIDADQLIAVLERQNTAKNIIEPLIKIIDSIPEQEHPIYELNQILLDWVREAKTDKEQEARFEAHKRFFELYDEYMVQEPEQPWDIPSAGGGMSTTPPSYKLDVKPEQPVEDLNELIRKWDRVNINTIQKAKVKTTGEIIDGFYDGRGHFDHFVDHDIFDRYSVEDVEPIIDKQPVEGLEEEIDRVIADYSFTKTIDSGGFKTTILDYAKIARHFAEWGAEHLKQ